MSGDELLATLNRRAIAEAVRSEAGRAGVDAGLLLDSRRFMQQAASLNPDAPEFTHHVRQLVEQAPRTVPTLMHPAPAPAVPGPADGQAPQPTAPNQPEQWDEARVLAASSAEVSAALEAGNLRSLGFGLRSRRR